MYMQHLTQQVTSPLTRDGDEGLGGEGGEVGGGKRRARLEGQ